MGERTTRFCDVCEKTLDHGRGFEVTGIVIPLGSDEDDDNVVQSGDFCPTCLGKNLNMTPDVLGEIMSGLDELFGPNGQAEKKPNIVDVITQSLDDLAEIVEPSAETKQKVKDLGASVQSNWTKFSKDLQNKMKKVFKVDESNPEKPMVSPLNETIKKKKKKKL